MEDRKLKKDIKFGLLENGFDFILSSLMYVAKPRTKSDLKYAILHLCAGMELILKERLRREHWSLLFEDINKANIRDFETGSFRSVSFGTCIDRLKGICNISVSLDNKKPLLFNFREKRNRLEHFGIVSSKEALTGSTAQVLSILLDFINGELLPNDFSKIERELLNQLRSKLSEFQNFVKRRLEQIDPDIKKAEKELYKVQCPTCYQETFILGNDNPYCLFCTYSTKPEFAAEEWDGGTYLPDVCPECGRETLVDIGPSGSQSKQDQYICFACGQAWKESSMNECMTCGNLYLVEEDDCGICPNCIEYQMSKG